MLCGPKRLDAHDVYSCKSLVSKKQSILYLKYLSLFSGVGSNNPSVPTVTSCVQPQLQNTVRHNTAALSECADNLRNTSLLNDILGPTGGNSSLGTNNVIVLNDRTSRNIPDDSEGQVVRTAVLLENGDSSSDNSRTIAMEPPGVSAVKTSVRGVFFKSEPLDGGAESGVAGGTSGLIGKVPGSNGK